MRQNLKGFVNSNSQQLCITLYKPRLHFHFHPAKDRTLSIANRSVLTNYRSEVFMPRPLLIALALASCLFSFSAWGSSFCIINETDKPVWLSLTQKDALRRGKLVFPKTEMCSTYQARRTLFISVSKRNGATTQCHQTLEPGSPRQLFLETVSAKYGCVWAAKTSDARPMRKSRRSVLCTVLAKESSNCKG